MIIYVLCVHACNYYVVHDSDDAQSLGSFEGSFLYRDDLLLVSHMYFPPSSDILVMSGKVVSHQCPLAETYSFPFRRASFVLYT